MNSYYDGYVSNIIWYFLIILLVGNIKNSYWIILPCNSIFLHGYCFEIKFISLEPKKKLSS